MNKGKKKKRKEKLKAQARLHKVHNFEVSCMNYCTLGNSISNRPKLGPKAKGHICTYKKGNEIIIPLPFQGLSHTPRQVENFGQS